ncbi:hypothetical protein ElyMa_003065400 [Elysia marginata]|uniref:Uncharacterized protein n=1 Tax=Elysia marginata TaxID=1093978 RepID=A0AAV4IMU4_9GAST|nr:hypothetical protein ElyMa_003065400 [Elysia marginata]
MPATRTILTDRTVVILADWKCHKDERGTACVPASQGLVSLDTDIFWTGYALLCTTLLDLKNIVESENVRQHGLSALWVLTQGSPATGAVVTKLYVMACRDDASRTRHVKNMMGGTRDLQGTLWVCTCRPRAPDVTLRIKWVMSDERATRPDSYPAGSCPYRVYMPSFRKVNRWCECAQSVGQNHKEYRKNHLDEPEARRSACGDQRAGLKGKSMQNLYHSVQ